MFDVVAAGVVFGCKGRERPLRTRPHHMQNKYRDPSDGRLHPPRTASNNNVTAHETQKIGTGADGAPPSDSLTSNQTDMHRPIW
eukprot:scaffold867_cov196-Alexandrium_tamarense.AAC.2